MSLSLMSDTNVFGPNDTLRKLSSEHLGLKILVTDKMSREVLRVFLTFDDYERFSKENIETAYDVIFVVDSDYGFPVDEVTRNDFKFVDKIVPHFGDHLLDYLYRCDGKWTSLFCHDENCCPALGKPVAPAVSFDKLTEMLNEEV